MTWFEALGGIEDLEDAVFDLMFLPQQSGTDHRLDATRSGEKQFSFTGVTGGLPLQSSLSASREKTDPVVLLSEWHDRLLVSMEFEIRFEPTEHGVLVTDRVRYALPFGPLGRLAHALWVHSALARIFDHRFVRVREILEGRSA